MLIGLADTTRPLHVGALLGNSPAMLRSMAAAGLGGYVLCGINTIRRGAGLLADIRRADCQLLLVDPDHLPLLDGLDLADVTVLDVTSRRYLDAVAGRTAARAAPRGRAGRYLDDDLHVGNQRRPEGGPVRPRGGNPLRRKPDRAVRDHRQRRVLPVHAVVSFQWRGRRLGGGHRKRRNDGSGPVLAVAVSARHPPLQRHLHELRRQAAGFGAGHPGEARTMPTTRCGWRSATRRPIAISQSSPDDSAAGSSTASDRVSLR